MNNTLKRYFGSKKRDLSDKSNMVMKERKLKKAALIYY